MRFTESAEADGLPMITADEHEATIVKAEEVKKPFLASDANPDGDAVEITLDVEGYAPFTTFVRADTLWLARVVAESAGVEAPGEGEDWDTEQLVGRSVRVKVKVQTSAKGNSYARVERWLKREPAAAKPAAARASRRGPPATSDGDDLPF